jgi:rhodanese-related sulfurtransferase
MRSAPALALAAALACAGPRPSPAPPPAAPSLPPGASAPAAPAQPLAPASPWRIDGATAALLVRSGARLVDVRTPEEFQKGHLPGALLLPHDQMERRATELGPPSTPLVVYCGTGKRSGEAAGTLRRLGYAEAWDLGPMSNWPATQ